MRDIRYFGAMLIGLALFAGAAAAQDASQSGQIDCASAQTQADLNTCAKMDFDEADSNLNDAYKAAVAKMQDLDKAATDKGAEAALRDAQRTWVTFRDQACASEGWTVHGGSMEPMVVLECKARVSGTRADDLWSLSEDSGG
jgi:uncharacterized protein YecT (DUF1311 family)